MKKYKVKKKWYLRLVEALRGEIMHRFDQTGYYVSPTSAYARREIERYGVKPYNI